MKKVIVSILLLFLASPAFAAEDQQGSNSGTHACQFVVNPLIYGRPVYGAVNNIINEDQPDLINSNLCFNVLKWMVLPEDENNIGEFGVFIYQNLQTGFGRECKYEVVSTIGKNIKNDLNTVYTAAYPSHEMASEFNQYVAELDRAVEVDCRFKMTGLNP